MAWHVGPPREHIPVADIGVAWYQFLEFEVADSKARWRLDAYMANVQEPVDIADTFLDEWLLGLWRLSTK